MIKDLLLLTVFPGAMAFAAATDLFTMTVPNRLALAMVGLVLRAGALGRSRLVRCRAPCRAGAGRAGGDLLHCSRSAGSAAATPSCSPRPVFGSGPARSSPIAIYAALLGGALTLVLLFWRRLPLPLLLTSQGWLPGCTIRQEGVPYGIALAAAGLLVYPDYALHGRARRLNASLKLRPSIAAGPRKPPRPPGFSGRPPPANLARPLT